KTLETIHTTDFVPPDLNSLLYQLELTIAKGCEIVRDAACVKEMKGKAETRKAAITRYLWNEKVGAFTDYDWRKRQLSSQVTLATVYPLYFKAASQAQAKTIATTLRSTLLKPHGLAAT